jgi:hypothetical protein
MISDTVVGLDVHAQSITAAILQGTSDQPEGASVEEAL